MSDTLETKDTFVKFSSVNEEIGLILGYAVVCKVYGEDYFDTQGDHIPESAMLKAATDFMKGSREARTMHGAEKTGDIVFAFPLTSDIAKSLGIKTDTTGLLIGMLPSDPNVLEMAKSGKLAGFSIGGKRVKDEIIDD